VEALEREGARGDAAPRQLSGRGLSYWSDGREERICTSRPAIASSPWMPGLETWCPALAGTAVVVLKLDDDQEIDLVTGEVGLHATPVVAGDTVIVGAAHRPGGVPKVMKNVRGYVRASTSGRANASGSSIPSPYRMSMVMRHGEQVRREYR